MSDELSTTLGVIIRRQRELAELSMKQLSSMVGISNPYLSQIENGLRAPSEQVLRGIAKSLGVPLNDLLPDTDEPELPLLAAIRDDPHLTARQRRALGEVYESMVAATRAARARRRP